MKLNRQTLLLPALLAAALTSLSACVPLVVGGAAVGTVALLDRRTSGTQVEDETIELRAASRVREAIPAGHINITSYNRKVLITGEAPTEAAKQLAGDIVAKVENVKGVVNELGVMSATSMSARSSDTLITGQVKASFLDDKSLYSGAFKVVTERGVVYLMGRVSRAEAERATQIARGVSGVQRVVRIFEILTDEEMRQLAAQGTAAPTPVAPAAAKPASGAR